LFLFLEAETESLSVLYEFNYSCLFDEFLILAIVNLSARFELEILTEYTYCNDHLPAVCQTALETKRVKWPKLDKGGKKAGTSKADSRSINGSCWLFIETLSVLRKINGSISKTSVVYYSQKIRKESKWNTTCWVVPAKESQELRNIWKGSPIFPGGIFQTQIRVLFLQNRFWYQVHTSFRPAPSFFGKWNWFLQMVNAILGRNLLVLFRTVCQSVDRPVRFAHINGKCNNLCEVSFAWQIPWFYSS